ncbi:MAG: Transcription termination factor Rho [Phycisphaerae bacterium]|nr:Transcription termination factor Rho [Phycisphaerae bacterium]
MDEVSGVLQMVKGGGQLRQIGASLAQRAEDPFVPEGLIRKHQLVSGATVAGVVPVGKGQRPAVSEVRSICGLDPLDFPMRTAFDQLTVIDPVERFHLGASGLMTMRVMDLVAPVGKGTRGQIVSPPKAGKTTILRDFCNAVRAEDPNLRIVVLLIDERPEEVTEFRRQVQAEVLASSLDQTAAEHVALAELVHDLVKCELECGRDVVVAIDSLTRMARAFNTEGGGSRGNNNGGRNGGRHHRQQQRRGGGILSGGLGAGVVEIPRRIFGLARNVEGGGSVTVIASILVDTGSRMDQVIFEEFKGTGNSELILDRRLSELRIFPAINIASSGTRREEKLLNERELKASHGLRRALVNASTEEAAQMLISRLAKFKTNEDFLASLVV